MRPTPKVTWDSHFKAQAQRAVDVPAAEAARPWKRFSQNASETGTFAARRWMDWKDRWTVGLPHAPPLQLEAPQGGLGDVTLETPGSPPGTCDSGAYSATSTDGNISFHRLLGVTLRAPFADEWRHFTQVAAAQRR